MAKQLRSWGRSSTAPGACLSRTSPHSMSCLGPTLSPSIQPSSGELHSSPILKIRIPPRMLAFTAKPQVRECYCPTSVENLALLNNGSNGGSGQRPCQSHISTTTPEDSPTWPRRRGEAPRRVPPAGTPRIPAARKSRWLLASMTRDGWRANLGGLQVIIRPAA